MSEINKTDNFTENTDNEHENDDNQRHSSHHSDHSHGRHHGHRHAYSRRHSRGHHSNKSHKRYSSRRNRTSNNPSKLLGYIKKRKNALINIVSCTISIVLLILFAFYYESKPESPTESNSVVDITKSSIKIETSVYLKEVPLINQAVKAFINDTTGKTAHDVYGEYQGYTVDLDGEIPVEYTYRVAGLPSGISLEKATLELCENATFEGGKTYSFADGTNSILIYHLLPGMQYHYRLNLLLSSGNTVSTMGTFKTAESPRILSIDGIYNVRDIGGWQTASGKSIQYGLLYRGTELDGGVEPTYRLTEKGIEDMVSELGIRLELDLRSESDNNGDVLGETVVHKNYPTHMYSYIFEKDCNEIVRSIFVELANKDNYPIYMHCTYGRDRTGTICYLLEALLGMSDSDLRKEFELSAFQDSYVNLEEFVEFVTRINVFEGSTTQEKVEGYLLSIGVTDEQIANIREIFLGE